MRSDRFIRLSSFLLVIALCAACGGQGAPVAKEANKPAAAPETATAPAGDAPAALAPFPDPPRGPHKTAIEEGVAFGSFNGFPLLMHIERPDPLPEKPMPVVIWLHGGGWYMGNASPTPNRFLAEHGFFTASVEYRSSYESKFPAQIHDVKAAVRWLRTNAEKLHIDPERIGVWGHSAGGHLAVLLGTSGDVAELEGDLGPTGLSSRVQAVVNLAGVIDMEHPRTEQWQEKERLLLFGGPQEEHADLVRLASPVIFLDADDPPVLTIHGTKDPNVPLHHSSYLHEKLKGAGVESEIRLLEGKDHWLVQYPAMPVEPEVKALTLAFFQKHLAQ
ncbi:MAG TPA: alpha/beta hydrolase [Symbiobacteriaceae bacterium]|jgi:acetyl esterase/lipase|nr:alpha/beta hydrolase [Symbiobacteriaceae bacterium]